jgi:D-alanyl-D-alanine dipeptidase
MTQFIPPAHAADRSKPVAHALQIVVVTGITWDSMEGRLERFERPKELDPWRLVGRAVPVAIGRGGFAWGRGAYDRNEVSGRDLTENDHRSPAGVFRIVQAFGTDPKSELPDLRMPYLPIEEGHLCVDDPESGYYNRIVKLSDIRSPDWRSAEAMNNPLNGYNLGILFAQNTTPPVADRGSCIFLHVGSPLGGTEGCTTLEEAPLRELARWLDPAANPLLVQLPEDEYRRLRNRWGLP